MEIPDQLSNQEIKPRSKDPKRVKAGLRSAEVRKQKAADIEAQLEKLSQLKTQMWDAQAPTAERVPEPQITVSQEPVVEQRDWTPWIVGGLGLAAVGWYLVKPKTSTPGRAVKQPAPPATLLKTRDPFYME